MEVNNIQSVGICPIVLYVNMSLKTPLPQSPSHAISLHFNGHSTNEPDDASNPPHALVTLSQTTTELGQDFILLIKCASLSLPAALLEAQPIIPNSNALIVTFIPKFNFPRGTRPEVVFILESLPLDVNFNICSFGSHHSFLWDRSRPYSNQTFAEAQEHCNRMQANFGGAETLPAIQSTIQRRQIGLNLEIMVLTDGGRCRTRRFCSSMWRRRLKRGTSDCSVWVSGGMSAMH